MLEALIFVVFPFCMAFAAISDMLSMTIANRVSVVLIVAFTIIAPRGTIVNCDFPAPVAGGNTETSPRITDMVFGALADAIPDRVVGSCGGTSSPFLFGGPRLVD